MLKCCACQNYQKSYYALPDKRCSIVFITRPENFSLWVTRHQVLTKHIKIDQRHQYLHDKAPLSSDKELRLAFLTS